MEKNISLKDYQKAYRSIVKKEQKTGFLIHSLFYVIVNAGLIAVNLLITPGYKWFYWPLAGWGFGLAMNYLFGVHLLGRFLGNNEKRAEKQGRVNKS